MPGLFENEDTARTTALGTTLVIGSDTVISESMLAESNPFQGLRKGSRAGITVLLQLTAAAAAGTVVKMTWNSTVISATLPALPIGAHEVKFKGTARNSTGNIDWSILTSAMSGPVTTSGGAATYAVNGTPTRPVSVNLGAGGAGVGHIASFQNC